MLSAINPSKQLVRDFLDPAHAVGRTVADAGPDPVLVGDMLTC